jgi:hypothetical protein
VQLLLFCRREFPFKKSTNWSHCVPPI